MKKKEACSCRDKSGYSANWKGCFCLRPYSEACSPRGTGHGHVFPGAGPDFRLVDWERRCQFKQRRSWGWVLGYASRTGGAGGHTAGPGRGLCVQAGCALDIFFSCVFCGVSSTPRGSDSGIPTWRGWGRRMCGLGPVGDNGVHVASQSQALLSCREH